MLIRFLPIFLLLAIRLSPGILLMDSGVDIWIPSVQWRVQYENAMLPPARKLLDVNMGAYAAGVRE